MYNPLSTRGIAKRNISRRPWRSISMIMMIFLFSFFLYAGSVFSISLSRGINSMANRLGADIIVVPEGYDPHIDSIILSGKPSSFYLPKDIMKKLDTIEGIEQITPQTFLATLNASCCSYPLQLIGIDYDSDFIIKPWLENTMKRKLKKGDIIVGYHVTGVEGQSIRFFGRDYPIAARLEQTGMGFDSAVFMTRETIADTAKDAVRIIKHPLSRDGSLISSVMLKLKPGYDSVTVARKINRAFNDDGIFALFSKKFVNTLSANLVTVSWLIRGGVAVIWLLAVIIIALLFAMSVNERKSEMAVLRILGATRKRLLSLTLSEALIISFYGSISGTGFAALAVLLISPSVTEILHLPFLLPSLTNLGLMFAGTLVISVLTCLMSAFTAALRGSRDDIYETVRGN